MDISAEVHERRLEILIGMSAEDVADRRNFFGASDANTLMSGDKEKIHRLWQEKCGFAEPEDLSNVLPVQMGVYTEDLNLIWYERQTGRKVFDRKQKVIHPHLPFLRATLDGKTHHPEDASTRCVIDAKHVNGFSNTEECLSKYAPQLAVQMACTDEPYGLLSIFFGNFKWEWAGISRDPLYETQVLSAIKVFWAHVLDQTPPNDLPSASPPLPVSMMRDVDMRFSNEWGSFEADYLDNETFAQKFNKAKDGLKGLVESDVKQAKGNKLMAKRGKDGSIRFSKVK